LFVVNTVPVFVSVTPVLYGPVIWIWWRVPHSTIEKLGYLARQPEGTSVDTFPVDHSGKVMTVVYQDVVRIEIVVVKDELFCFVAREKLWEKVYKTLRARFHRFWRRETLKLVRFIVFIFVMATDTTAAASTTSSNVSARLTTLSASTLPFLFLHAIKAAHKLHVPYLWIDSLCILQDSKEDFATEAAMMSTTYRNSYCTISAGLDNTNTLGLFRQRDVHYDAVEFELRDTQGEMRRVRAVKQQEWWTTMFEEGPLQQRGWYPQERELFPASYISHLRKSSGNAAALKLRKAYQKRL
jgi:hypothetical protein